MLQASKICLWPGVFFFESGVLCQNYAEIIVSPSPGTAAHQTSLPASTNSAISQGITRQGPASHPTNL